MQSSNGMSAIMLIRAFHYLIASGPLYYRMPKSYHDARRCSDGRGRCNCGPRNPRRAPTEYGSIVRVPASPLVFRHVTDEGPCAAPAPLTPRHTPWLNFSPSSPSSRDSARAGICPVVRRIYLRRSRGRPACARFPGQACSARAIGGGRF